MLSRETCASTSSSTSLSARGGRRACSAPTADMRSSLSHAEDRIMAAWARIGLADRDRQRKWASFVDGRLRPFLQDYVRLQEAEEMALAAENDRLFRELLFLSRRLKETPKTTELAQLVDAMDAQGVSLNGAADGLAEEGDDVVADSEINSSTLPSFVAVASAMALCRGSEALSSATDRAASPRAREESEQQNECKSSCSSALEGRRRSPTPQGLHHGQCTNTAKAAVWHIAHSMTHQELRRNLEAEVARMSALADARLRQLCVLYKQRALLQLPPQEQATLRKKYAERILSHNTTTMSTMSTMGSGEAKRPLLLSSAPVSSRQSAATAGLTSGRATHTTPTDELDLLSDSLPEQLQSHDGDITWTSIHPNEKDGKEVKHDDDEEEGENGGEVDPHRGTIFSVDLSDLTRFGRRQDLSLARIGAEAQEIYAEINAQNDSMAAQAAQELKYVEELWDIFKAPIQESQLKEGVDTSAKEEGEIKGNETLTGDDEKQTEVIAVKGKDECNETETAMDLQEISAENEEEKEKDNDKDDDDDDNDNDDVPSLEDVRYRLAQLQAEYEQNHPLQKQNQKAHFTSSESHGFATLDESTPARYSDTTTLPSPLMRLFTACSFVPILTYIIGVREDMQRRLLQRHVRIAQSVTQRLTGLYREYYDKTLDTAYSVAPDYSLWLRENADAAVASAAVASAHSSMANVHIKMGISHDKEDVEEEKKCGKELWAHVLSTYTPRGGDDPLRERIAEVRHVISRAQAEAHSLLQRLSLLSAAEPLLRRRADIIAQQRAMRDSSRERLLSKKVNMAKQLLFEENARRQFARELPRLHEQLEGLLRQWERAVGAEIGPRRFAVRGADVAAVVREFREEERSAAAGARRGTTGPRALSKPRSRSPPPFAVPSPLPAQRAPVAAVAAVGAAVSRGKERERAMSERGAPSPAQRKRMRLVGPTPRGRSQTPTPHRTG